MKLSVRKLRKFSMLLLYFSRFITTTVPAQALLFCLFFRRPSLPRKVWLYLILIIWYWTTVFVLRPSVVPWRNLLFYFSFALPTIVMFSNKSKDAYTFIANNFVILVCILAIAEAIIINSPFVGYLSYLNAVPSEVGVGSLWSYRKPVGVAGNASMTSCVLVFSLVLADTIRDLFSENSDVSTSTPFFSSRTLLVAVSIIVVASGTGFGLFLLYSIWRGLRQVDWTVKKLKRAVAILAIPVIAIVGAFGYFNDTFNKFGWEYALIIVDDKIEKIIGAMGYEGTTYVVFLFGRQIEAITLNPATSGDFGLGVMYMAIGVLGSICVLATPLLFVSSLRKLVVPTIFFYLTFVHYPGLLSPPGAVLFGLYLFLLWQYENMPSLRRI